MTAGDLAIRWRDCFLEIIQEPSRAALLKDAAISVALMDWTAQLTASVVRSCEALGWCAAAKGHTSHRLPKAGQEFLALDVMAFPGKGEADLPARWPLPITAVELENSVRDERVAYSLWKVLCVKADLRIVFAYRPDWDKARQIVTMLEGEVIGSLTIAQRDTLGGQTILVLGSRGEGETFPWGYFKFWKLDANLGRFIKI